MGVPPVSSGTNRVQPAPTGVAATESSAAETAQVQTQRTSDTFEASARPTRQPLSLDGGQVIDQVRDQVRNVVGGVVNEVADVVRGAGDFVENVVEDAGRFFSALFGGAKKAAPAPAPQQENATGGLPEAPAGDAVNTPAGDGGAPADAGEAPAPSGTTGATLDPQDLQSRNGFPWISQLAPQGAAEGMPNGEVMCGPASFAMIARKTGWNSELSDAELMTKLAEIGKTQPGTGTSMNGVVAMAHAMGLGIDKSEVSFPGFNQEWMDGELSKGKQIVANGALETEKGPSGHFVLITGKDAAGRYQVNDPWDAENRSMDPVQLQDFLKRNPVHGGASVAIG